MEETGKTTELEQENTNNTQQSTETNTDPTTTTDSTQTTETGKVYSETELAELKIAWQQELAQSQAAEKDFEKMTPEQQAQKQLDDQKIETEKLKAQLADRDLVDYARVKIAEAELPLDALSFVKGKDQADTDAKIKAFSALLAGGVQTGVEARFKQNGYTPRTSAAGKSAESERKRTRGITIESGK